MTNIEQYQDHIEYTFNVFCKIVLYHAALKAYRKLRKKQRFEISLDYLHVFRFEPVTTIDEYFVKYDEPTAFTVHGETVIVASKTLATALLRLPKERREVLLSRFYLDYSDVKIREIFGVCRSGKHSKYLSYFQGRINKEIEEQLNSDLLTALFRFWFDR